MHAISFPARSRSFRSGAFLYLIEHPWLARLWHNSPMTRRKRTKGSDKELLTSVRKEMGQPRISGSVREKLAKL